MGCLNINILQIDQIYKIHLKTRGVHLSPYYLSDQRGSS